MRTDGAGARGWETRVQLGAHPVAYPLARGLARLGPAVRVPRVGIVVSCPRLARAVLLDPAGFTKTGPGSPAELWTPVVGSSVLLNMEGAEHAELRGRLAGLFTPSAVDRLCARVLAAPLGELTDRLRSGRVVDLVPAVQHLAGAVIAELVGLDAAHARSAFAAGSALTAMVRPTRPRLTDAQVAVARRTLSTLTGPAASAWADGDPATVPGRMRELGLSRDEALGATAAFVLTGTETLVSFLPRLVAQLVDTGWWDELAAPATPSPELLDAVTAEALRVSVPSPAMLRSVAAPGRIGDVPVRPGERVIILTVNAARSLGSGFDPCRPHPPPLRRLWFGAGSHFCLGMPLATAEIRTVLAALRTLGALRIVRRRVARRVLIPGYRTLEVAGGRPER